MARKVSLSSDGNPTPYTQEYPHPKAPASVGKGSDKVSKETKKQMKSFLAPGGFKNDGSRPKGV